MGGEDEGGAVCVFVLQLVDCCLFIDNSILLVIKPEPSIP